MTKHPKQDSPPAGVGPLAGRVGRPAPKRATLASMAAVLRAADARAALEYMLPELEADERYAAPPCVECGAKTADEAARMCRGAAVDDCPGNLIWPDA